MAKYSTRANRNLWHVLPPHGLGQDSPAMGWRFKLPIRLAFLIASLWVLVTLPLYVAPLIVAIWLPKFAFLSIAGWLWAAFFLNVLPAFFLVIGEPRRIIVGRREIVTGCGWPPFALRRRFPLEEFAG